MAQTQFSELGIYNALIPQEGPRIIPIVVDFSQGQSQLLDFQQAFALKRISNIQSAWVDNSATNIPVVITIANTGQNIIVRGRAQGYIPLLAQAETKVTVTSVGNTGVFRISVANVPIDSILYSTVNNTNTYDGSGNLLVSDTVLDSTVSNGRVNTLNYGLMTGGVAAPLMWGNVAYSGLGINAGTTTITTGAPGWILTGVKLQITGSATQASVGDVSVDILEGTTVLASYYGYVGMGASGLVQNIVTLTDLNLTSKVSASNLSWRRNNSLTTGSYVLTAQYALTSFVG